MKTYEVVQTYWNINDDEEDCVYYYAYAEVEANSPEEAKEKACKDGMFDDQYEFPFDEIGISDVYEVNEI